MEKIGRNAPCPCGSGKKYKKCCLEKEAPLVPRVSVADDHERRSASAQAEAPLFGRGGSDRDQVASESEAEREYQKKIAEEQARWQRFREELAAAPVDEKVRMVLEVIEREDDFDGELAFMLVEEVQNDLLRAVRLDDLEKIIRKIEERRPEAYAEEPVWMNYYLANIALLRRESDLLTPLMALAREAEHSIDQFLEIVYRLFYHGRAEELQVVLPEAWSRVKDSREIMMHGIEMVRDMSFSLALYDALKQTPELDPDDPGFREQVRDFWDGDDEPLRRIVFHLSGRGGREWRPGDFPNLTGKTTSDNLRFMSMDFCHYLRNEKGWPELRAELAWGSICEYLWRQEDDRKKSGKKLPGSINRLLLPHAPSADKFATSYLGFLGSRPYHAAAFCLALKPWMEFLAERGLVDEDLLEPAWEEIALRMERLPKILNEIVFDPVMVVDVITRLQEGW